MQNCIGYVFSCGELGIFFLERFRKLIMKGTIIFFLILFYSAHLRITYFGYIVTYVRQKKKKNKTDLFPKI